MKGQTNERTWTNEKTNQWDGKGGRSALLRQEENGMKQART
jgi:hypothetical protein